VFCIVHCQCTCGCVKSKKNQKKQFGVTLLEILERREPYGDMGGLDVATRVGCGVLKPELLPEADEYFKQIMQDCTQFEPEAVSACGNVL